MKINVDRLCQLAGLPEERSGVLNEASNRSLAEDPSLSDEAAHRFGSNQLSEGEAEELEKLEALEAETDETDETDEADESQILEIDEVELVQELRRAKAMIAEAKRKKALSSNRNKNIQESQLKNIIESEIASVMDELNLGYTHQGSFLKVVGFE